MKIAVALLFFSTFVLTSSAMCSKIKCDYVNQKLCMSRSSSDITVFDGVCRTQDREYCYFPASASTGECRKNTTRFELYPTQV